MLCVSALRNCACKLFQHAMYTDVTCTTTGDVSITAVLLPGHDVHAEAPALSCLCSLRKLVLSLLDCDMRKEGRRIVRDAPLSLPECELADHVVTEAKNYSFSR